MLILSFILIFQWLIHTTDCANKPWEVSARTFRKAPQDSGYRREMSQLKESKYNFWRFLEWYADSTSNYEKMKIMGDYYRSHSIPNYRILSLMFLFNAYDPMSIAQQRFMVRFLKEYCFEENVLALFLYRYATIPIEPRLSFRKLYHLLSKEIPDFHIADLESLHFLDHMIAMEARPGNFQDVQKDLDYLWKNEIRRNTLIYQRYRDWFRKVSSYYTLSQRRQNFLPRHFSVFLQGRERLFNKHGLSYHRILQDLEDSFQVDYRALELPPFLPAHLQSLFYQEMGIEDDVLEAKLQDSPFR